MIISTFVSPFLSIGYSFVRGVRITTVSTFFAIFFRSMTCLSERRDMFDCLTFCRPLFGSVFVYFVAHDNTFTSSPTQFKRYYFLWKSTWSLLRRKNDDIHANRPPNGIRSMCCSSSSHYIPSHSLHVGSRHPFFVFCVALAL